MINIIIADDHPILRKALVGVLNSIDNFRITAEVKSVEELIKTIDKVHYDIILLDLTIPQKGGIWALTQIMDQDIDNKIIIFSASNEKQIVLSTLNLGAMGFVNKESDTDEIIDAINEVYKGNIYISPSIEKIINKEISNIKNKKTKKLSKRELQCFALSGEGKTITQIAEILGLSVKTVSTYKTRIFSKLGINNNSELIRFAIDHNLQSSFFIEDKDNQKS